MASSLEWFAKRADELASGIEDEDGGMIFEILAAFVNHIEIAGLVDRYVMRGLPSVLVGQLRPFVRHFILIIAFADHKFCVSLFGGDDARSANCGGDADCGRGGEELAAGGHR
jgi:hypothetical protein